MYHNRINHNKDNPANQSIKQHTDYLDFLLAECEKENTNTRFVMVASDLVATALKWPRNRMNTSSLIDEWIGRTLSHITVQTRIFTSQKGMVFYQCACDCGVVFLLNKNQLRKYDSTMTLEAKEKQALPVKKQALFKDTLISCGCHILARPMMSLVGQRINGWLVMKFDFNKTAPRERFYFCRCVVCLKERKFERGDLIRKKPTIAQCCGG